VFYNIEFEVKCDKLISKYNIEDFRFKVDQNTYRPDIKYLENINNDKVLQRKLKLENIEK
jgi:hypothetical protein